ncbi:MAG: hypothetical protein JXA20_08625 [Spirochaetes bacterium]|nr:hypothetical protein [Spirochaetota bacterium]
MKEALEERNSGSVMLAGIADDADIEYMDSDELEVEGALRPQKKAKPKTPAPPPKPDGAPTPFLVTSEEDGVLYIHDVDPVEAAREAAEAEEAAQSSRKLILDGAGNELEDEVYDEDLSAEERGSEEDGVIDISEELESRIPESFDVGEIGSVNLREAEEIANETLLSISDKDLLEDLEGIESIIVEEEGGEPEEAPPSPKKSVTQAAPERRPAPERTVRKPQARAEAKRPAAAQRIESDTVPAPAKKGGGIPVEEKPVETGTVLEPALPSGDGSVVPSGDVYDIDVFAGSATEPETAAVKEVSAREKEEPVPQSQFHTVEEIEIATPSTGTEGMDEPAAGQETVVETAPPAAEKKLEVQGVTAQTPAAEESQRIVTEREELQSSVPEEKPDAEPPMEAPLGPAAVERERYHEKSVVPAVSDIPVTEGLTIFIDDSGDSTGLEEQRNIPEVGRLDRITADLVDLEVGSAIVLSEGEMVEELGQDLPVSVDLKALQDEFIFEFVDEFKYRDDELEFVHTSIMQDEYTSYLRTIDEFQKSKSERGMSRAVEIFGLTGGELRDVNDVLFSQEYEHVDLHEIFDFFREDSTKRDLNPSIAKECRYILPHSGSLDGDERGSIEEDISSSNALVFEEDVEKIRLLLDKPDGAVAAVPKQAKAEREDDIHDITDRVVIIEDEEDIDRFVKEFPADKRESLKKLMRYFDGLFEKLPESAVKTFANSEYFDLYIKVMNDLDV